LLNHVAAGFGAGATFFRAVGHDFVTGKMVASGRTVVAAFRATRAHVGDNRTLAGGERSGQLTARGAIDAQLSGALVLLLTARQEAEAMPMARITAQLTICARSRACHERFLRFRIGRSAQRRQHSGYQQGPD
jgi:hypothetical protein